MKVTDKNEMKSRVLSSKKSVTIFDHIIIGAGFAGICMGIKLRERGCENFIILETEKDVGGTWYKNKYPGAACDVPSHFYCYSFEPNPNWSHIYSPQEEIQEYIRFCSDKYGITPKIRFNSSVSSARFEEKTGLWQVYLENGHEFKCRHFIIGSGGLNTPVIPPLPGLKEFAGPSFHTAQWNSDTNLADKNIVVIGSAASAVQAVPVLAKTAKHVTMFQRTPNYIAPRNDRAYSKHEKTSFRQSALRRKLTRWAYYWRYDGFIFPIFKQKSRLRDFNRDRVLKYMKSIVTDPVLQKKMTPGYELGCKRILISDDFYPALMKDNVSVVTEGIQSIGPDDVTDNTGKKHPADILVLATGFSIRDQMTSIDIIGPGNNRLNDKWEIRPEAYRGAQVAGFPNLFFITGPNTGVGSTSVVCMIEAQIAYILKCLDETGTDKLLDVKPEAMDRHNAKIQKQLNKMVWAANCDSWYKDKDGYIHALYPNRATTFRLERRRLDMKDLILTTRATT